jgi:hypothetical protein
MRITLILALALASSVPFQPAAADTKKTTAACTGIGHYVAIGRSPVQVNPGARCEMQFRLPPGCLFVRQAGSQKALGPFCVDDKGKGSVRLPNNIEWVWSAGAGFNADLTLYPRGHFSGRVR